MRSLLLLFFQRSSVYQIVVNSIETYAINTHFVLWIVRGSKIAKMKKTSERKKIIILFAPSAEKKEIAPIYCFHFICAFVIVIVLLFEWQ